MSQGHDDRRGMQDSGLTCPVCSSRLPLNVVRYGPEGFSCPACEKRICIPRSYQLRLALLSIAVTVFAAYVLGARNAVLLLAVVIATFPVMMVTSSIARRVVPARLVIAEDYRA